MSELSNDILQDFAQTVIGPEEQEKTKQIYGTIIEQDGKKYVKIDGTDVKTPVNALVEIEKGDRVLVQIEGREVNAVSNVTAPASARTATNFIKLTKDGFMVGELDDEGNPTGTHTLMKYDSFLIVDKNNRVLASFTSDSISFGNKATFGENGVSFYNGIGNVLATFTADGLMLYNGNSAFLATFTADGLILYDGKGNAIMSLHKDGIDFKNTWLYLRSPMNAQLEARKDDSNWALLRTGYFDGDTSRFECFDNENGEQKWTIKVDGEQFFIDSRKTSSGLYVTGDGISLYRSNWVLSINWGGISVSNGIMSLSINSGGVSVSNGTYFIKAQYNYGEINTGNDRFVIQNGNAMINGNTLATKAALDELSTSLKDARARLAECENRLNRLEHNP